MVTGIFRDEEHVGMAIDALFKKHYSADDVSVVVATKKDRHEVPLVFKSGITRGGLVGGALGIAAGGVGAVLAATGVLTGAGLALFAAGPLHAAIAGLGFGSAVGALEGLGVWHEEVELDPSEVRAGRVLVGANVRGDNAEVLQQAFADLGAERITLCDTTDATCEQARV
jgi:hypothetical protein